MEDWNKIVGMIAVLVGLLAVTVFAFLPEESPGAITAGLWRVVAWPVLWTARMLNRTRPLHPFRWVALLFFITGSLIDLITSVPRDAPAPQPRGTPSHAASTPVRHPAVRPWHERPATIHTHPRCSRGAR